MYNYGLPIKRMFEDQIESDIQRKIRLIRYISTEKRWYTFEEISMAVNASAKTIGKDLRIIKEIMPETWHIQIQKGFGVKLSLPLNESIEEVNCRFFRSSLTFQVLNKLLKYGETTATNLADELHIQPYVVTKVLKKVEKELMYYNLKLHRNPLKIIGQESRIIFMFSELYFKAYLNSDWPFQYNQERILDFIEKMEAANNAVLLLSSRRIFSYYTAISLLRKEKNYHIQQIEKPFYLNEETEYSNKSSECLDRFGEEYGVYFSKSEKIRLITVFKCLNYICDYSDENKELKIKLFQDHKIPLDDLVSEFIGALYDSFKYPFMKEEEFICSMVIHFRKRIYSLYFSSYIKRFERSFLNEMKKKHLKTYLKVKEIYTKWIKRHEITNSISEEEILSIVIYIEAARIYNSLKPKKILVITKEGDYLIKYIQAILKENFGDKVDFPAVFSINIAKGLKFLEPEYDIDFIISTMPLQINSHPIIQINPCVSGRDLDNIQSYLD